MTIPNTITPKTGNKPTRSIGLDIIRFLAILFVIAGHFFINTPGVHAIFEGPSMFLQSMGLTLFMTNVPLFLILTGYLNLNKKISCKYYKGMIAVILSYVFISVVTIIFREKIIGEHLSIIKWILKITDFSAINYAWYIEMWIGLYLLTPFLNILWHNLESKKHKRILICTLYILCALPDFFNRYGVHLMPGYWRIIYPCGFYFIGSYIKEYQPIIPRHKLLIFMTLCCLFNPIFNTLFVHNHSLIQLAGSGSGVIGFPMATAVFLLCYRINFSYKWLRATFTSISKLSLDMYLASYMFDLVTYKYFKEHFYVTQSQFGAYFFVIIPTVFICSYLFALVKRWLFTLLHLPT